MALIQAGRILKKMLDVLLFGSLKEQKESFLIPELSHDK